MAQGQRIVDVFCEEYYEVDKGIKAKVLEREIDLSDSAEIADQSYRRHGFWGFIGRKCCQEWVECAKL
jgi:hypothetical protein